MGLLVLLLYGCLVFRFLSLADSEWRTCQLTALTGSHLKPSCACLFMFLLLTWTCCSHLSSRGKLDSFRSPLCVVRLPVPSPFGCFLVVVDSFATARPHGCHFRTSSSFSVLARLVHNLSYLFAISCCLSSGACWFCFRSEVYSLFFCKPHNSRDKGLLVAIRLGMLHLGATCKQMRPFSVGCVAKDVSSSELAVPQKWNNTSAQLALTQVTGGKLLLAFLFALLALRDLHEHP